MGRKMVPEFLTKEVIRVSQFILDLFFITVFVLMLVLLHQAKGRIFKRNKDSFRYTYGGLLALCISALIQTIGHQNLLENVPLISEEIFRNVIEAIGIVAGVTLMIAGASFWLPRKQERAATEETKDGSRFPYEVHRSIYHGTNANDIFTSSFEKICRQYGFTGFALYRYSSRYRQYVCTDCNNLGRELAGKLRNDKFRPAVFDAKIESIKKECGFEYLLPVETVGKIGAVAFFHKQKNSELTENDRRELRLIGNEISQRITGINHSLKAGFYDYCWECYSSLTGIVSKCSDISSGLKDVYRIFYRTLGSEYLSIAVIDRTKAGSRRFSVGINGNVLLDNAPLPDLRASHLGEVISSGKRLKLDDIDSVERRPIDSLFLSCGQKSLLAIPVFQSGIITGIISIGSPRKNHFNRRRELLGGLLCRALATLVVREAGRFLRRKALRYNDEIFNFSGKVEKLADLNEIYDATAGIIRQAVNVSFVRIDEVSADRTSLIEKACDSLRPHDSNSEEKILLDKSETESYWRTVMLGEIAEVTVDGSDNEKTVKELGRSGLTKMKSVTMIPIKTGGLTTLVITLADMREKKRTAIDSSDITFVYNIGSSLQSNLRAERLSRAFFRTEGSHSLKLNLPVKETAVREDELLSELEEIAELTDSRIIPGLQDSLSRSHLDIARMVENPDQLEPHNTTE